MALVKLPLLFSRRTTALVGERVGAACGLVFGFFFFFFNLESKLWILANDPCTLFLLIPNLVPYSL